MDFFSVTLYRIQLRCKIDSSGHPMDPHFFDEIELFTFDSDGNCFVFVSDYVKFVEFINKHYSSSLYIKSIVHISDDCFIYEE